MSELAKMVSSCGPMDILCMVTNKPKIEFDDLKKLDSVIALNPQIGVTIAYALVHYTGEAFITFVKQVLIDHAAIPPNRVIGKIHEDIF